MLCITQLKALVYVLGGVTQMTSAGQQLPVLIYQIEPILTSGSVCVQSSPTFTAQAFNM